MSVITFSREFGSDGDQISRQVAKELGYQLVNKDVIEEVLVKYGMVAFDEMYSTEHGIWGRFDSEKTRIVEMLNKTILAFARRGNCVIVGRGAFAVLHEYNDVVNVCIKTPLEKRIKNIMTEHDLEEPAKAGELIKQSDRVRSSFLQTFYGIKSKETGWFDLCIDTRIIPEGTAIKWIVEAAKEMEAEEAKMAAASESTTEEISKDVVLQSAIDEVLAEL